LYNITKMSSASSGNLRKVTNPRSFSSSCPSDCCKSQKMESNTKCKSSLIRIDHSDPFSMAILTNITCSPPLKKQQIFADIPTMITERKDKGLVKDDSCIAGKNICCSFDMARVHGASIRTNQPTLTLTTPIDSSGHNSSGFASVHVQKSHSAVNLVSNRLPLNRFDSTHGYTHTLVCNRSTFTNSHYHQFQCLRTRTTSPLQT
jgi:hypothetical protein